MSKIGTFHLVLIDFLVIDLCIVISLSFLIATAYNSIFSSIIHMCSFWISDKWLTSFILFHHRLDLSCTRQTGNGACCDRTSSRFTNSRTQWIPRRLFPPWRLQENADSRTRQSVHSSKYYVLLGFNSDQISHRKNRISSRVFHIFTLHLSFLIYL